MMRYLLLTTSTVCFALLLGALGGCSHNPPSQEWELPPERQFKDLANYEVLLKESRAEADRYRSEIAAMRIAAAKQNGNLFFAQAEAGTVPEREAELSAQLQQKNADISKLEAERDQLQQQNIKLQARSAALPDMRQLVMDIKALQTSVHQMSLSMQALSTDMTKIKRVIALSRKRQRTTAPKMAAVPAAPPRTETPKLQARPAAQPSTPTSARAPRPRNITVKKGDTLYSIAKAHGTTVQELKEVNSLETDTISISQQLVIPGSHSTPPQTKTQPALAKNKSKVKKKALQQTEGATKAIEEP